MRAQSAFCGHGYSQKRLTREAQYACITRLTTHLTTRPTLLDPVKQGSKLVPWLSHPEQARQLFACLRQSTAYLCFPPCTPQGNVFGYDILTGNCLMAYPFLHDTPATSCVFLPDHDLLITTAMDTCASVSRRRTCATSAAGKRRHVPYTPTAT